jgi:Ca-activated chloride channel family protein
VPIGTFSTGEQKTLLARLTLPNAEKSSLEVADVRLEYTDLGRNTQGTCSGSLGVNLVDESGEVSELDALVAGRIQRSETSASLTEANKLWKQGRVDEAKEELRKSLASLEQRKRSASGRVNSARKAEFEGDFEKQKDVLSKADENFAKPPPGKPAAAPRASKAQVRRNQEEALELGF